MKTPNKNKHVNAEWLPEGRGRGGGRAKWVNASAPILFYGSINYNSILMTLFQRQLKNISISNLYPIQKKLPKPTGKSNFPCHLVSATWDFFFSILSPFFRTMNASNITSSSP